MVMTFVDYCKIVLAGLLLISFIMMPVVSWKYVKANKAQEQSTLIKNQVNTCMPKWECTTDTHGQIDLDTGLTCQYGQYWSRELKTKYHVETK